MNQNNSCSRVIESDDLSATLEALINRTDHNGLFIFTDSNVERAVIPGLSEFLQKFSPEIIVMPAGEDHKNLKTLAWVWQRLSEGKATRNSLMINIGGGVVTDLGGFAAATFKRGIKFINVPTTVLGAVDAAVGGKTGIDFNGLKNEIGAFALAEWVVISSAPLLTLPESEIVSGYGEIIKTAMFSSAKFYYSLLSDCLIDDMPALKEAMAKSVREKERVTDADLREGGLRKILNLGHTAGHALETLMIERGTPVTHGAAVAHGLLVTLILSHLLKGLPSEEIYKYADEVLKPLYGRLIITCKDYDRLEEIMSHDKKNKMIGEVRFVLLEDIGKPVIDIAVPSSELRNAIDIYCDIMGV